jgi:hypothetical protein
MDPELKKLLIEKLQQQVIGSLDGELRYLFGKDGCRQWDEENCDDVICAGIENIVNEILK